MDRIFAPAGRFMEGISGEHENGLVFERTE
jgi:hypothetical protein